MKNTLSSSADDPFARARLTITAETTGEDLDRLLSDARNCDAPPANGRNARRATAWRCYRRMRHHTTARLGSQR